MKESSMVITDDTKETDEELSTWKKTDMADGYDLYTARDDCKHD